MTGSVPMRTERRAFAALRDQGATDRSSYPLTAGRSNYIPYYKRQQMEREAKVNIMINISESRSKVLLLELKLPKSV